MVITLRLIHRFHRSWLTHLRAQVPAMPGSAVIGIRPALVIPGAQDIGLIHRIRMHTGLGRATTGTVTTADTGGGDYQADLSLHTSRASTAIVGEQFYRTPVDEGAQLGVMGGSM